MDPKLRALILNICARSNLLSFYVRGPYGFNPDNKEIELAIRRLYDAQCELEEYLCLYDAELGNVKIPESMSTLIKECGQMLEKYNQK